MFDNIRKRIGMSYTRFHFRRKREAPMQFTDILSRSRRALVIFPETVLDSESSQTLPRYFLRKFAPGSVLFVIRQDLLSSIAAGPTAKIAIYSESDVNTWFIPRDTLLRKVKTSTFDVVVDLNLELALPSAFVCRETDAPLRIGFAKESGDAFYNFQVQPRYGSSAMNACRLLMKCLDMF